MAHWAPVSGDLGLMGMLFGSIASASLSTLLSLPLSLALAYMLTLDGKSSPLIKLWLEVLAATPSVVFTVVGALFIVPKAH